MSFSRRLITEPLRGPDLSLDHLFDHVIVARAGDPRSALQLRLSIAHLHASTQRHTLLWAVAHASTGRRTGERYRPAPPAGPCVGAGPRSHYCGIGRRPLGRKHRSRDHRSGRSWRVGRRRDSGASGKREVAMWGMGRNGRGAVVAAGMLVGAAVLVGASPDATAQQAPPVVVGAGQLRLHLFGTGGTVTWEVNGAVVKTQTISSSRCQVSTSGAQLLTFTPSAGDVGLVSNGLGVRTKNNCNTAEGRVSVGESLQVALGSAVPLDMRVTTAALDIEGKFNASLDYSLGDDPTDYAPIPLANASDNGPDAGPGDNVRVTIFLPFFFSSRRPRSGRSRSCRWPASSASKAAVTTPPRPARRTRSSRCRPSSTKGSTAVSPSWSSVADEAASNATFVRGPNEDPPTPRRRVPGHPGDARDPARRRAAGQVDDRARGHAAGRQQHARDRVGAAPRAPIVPGPAGRLRRRPQRRPVRVRGRAVVCRHGPRDGARSTRDDASTGHRATGCCRGAWSARRSSCRPTARSCRPSSTTATATRSTSSAGRRRGAAR